MRDTVLTDRGPKPIGPYSQAIRANGFLYVSGQVALDPKTGEMIGGDISQQTERTLENVKGIVEAAGSRMRSVRSGLEGYGSSTSRISRIRSR